MKAPESAQEKVGEFIYQLQPKIKTLVRKLERVLKLSLSFNQACFNVGRLRNYIYSSW